MKWRTSQVGIHLQEEPKSRKKFTQESTCHPVLSLPGPWSGEKQVIKE